MKTGYTYFQKQYQQIIIPLNHRFGSSRLPFGQAYLHAVFTKQNFLERPFHLNVLNLF